MTNAFPFKSPTTFDLLSKLSILFKPVHFWADQDLIQEGFLGSKKKLHSLWTYMYLGRAAGSMSDLYRYYLTISGCEAMMSSISIYFSQ